MPVFFQSGFEQNAVTDWTGSDGTPTVQSTTKRNGTYALQITSLVSATAKDVYQSLGGVAVHRGPTYFTCWFRVDTLPSAENTIIAGNDQATGGSPFIWRITLSGTGTLTLYDEDGAIGSPSSALTTATWYKISVFFSMGNTANGVAGHVIRAFLDDSNFAGATNRNLGAALGAYIIGGNLSAEAQTVGNWYFDDITINDKHTKRTTPNIRPHLFSPGLAR